LEDTFGLARLMAQLGNDPPLADLAKSAVSSVRSCILIDLVLLPVELFPKQMSGLVLGSHILPQHINQ